ncbi:MAG: hypothetical protein QM751_12610 [Paludibacteraceae bacterium]
MPKGEIALIQKAIIKNKAILGVCLGAQLLGEAFGAKVEHSPHKEIGVYPIYTTTSATIDELFSSFPERLLVGHWHGDMPGLTNSAKVLAYSDGCPRQIIEYKSRVYGFQCHFEFTAESIENMLKEGNEIFEIQKKIPFVCKPEFLKTYDYSEMNSYLFSFLDKLEVEIKRTNP